MHIRIQQRNGKKSLTTIQVSCTQGEAGLLHSQQSTCADSLQLHILKSYCILQADVRVVA